ncbi:MAG: DUF1788 domain-containing protein [Erysipelotrichia bacterium]|nr:DUF1788 domain-containing protein [Erysipelotrichia bacterium]
MSKNIHEKSLSDRFHHLHAVISGQRFLKKQGLGNEVPFFICPYKPEEHNEMIRMQGQLVNKLEQKGIRVLEINLYDLAVEMLQQREIWEQTLAVEKDVSKSELKEMLQGVLDAEKHMVPAIAAKMADAEFDVMFPSGAGEVYPYIRSHNILNNLQSTAKDKPTLMFFPGEYTHSLESGASLNLFGIFHDGYYRAFNIFHCEP